MTLTRLVLWAVMGSGTQYGPATDATLGPCFAYQPPWPAALSPASQKLLPSRNHLKETGKKKKRANPPQSFVTPGKAQTSISISGVRMQNIESM